MYAVDDKTETIHLYVVREPERRPSAVFPAVCAILCLLGIVVVTVYSAGHPTYMREQITVPARFLPLKTFTAKARIIPTGIKTYPATYASGIVTLTNGSVLSEALPAGVVFSAGNGINVETTQAVFIPAGSADGYGLATVPARSMQAGTIGNVPTLAINAVYGTALYVRNLSPFSGGQNVYTITFTQPQDVSRAAAQARAVLNTQEAAQPLTLAAPCAEALNATAQTVMLSWHCRFATYRVPAFMQVLSARLEGKRFIVTVTYQVLAVPRRPLARFH